MSSKRQAEVIRAQLVSKAVLSPDQTELYDLTQLAGVTMDQQVFKIILDLLKLNVPPEAITRTLRSMCTPHKHGDVSLGDALLEHLPASFDHSASISTHGRKDLSQDLINWSQHSDHTARTSSRSHQDRSSDQNRLALASDSNGQDGNSYSSFTSGKANSQSSSRSQSHLTSDISYGKNKSRSRDSGHGQNTLPRDDSHVTTRQAFGISDDNDSYRNKESHRHKSPFK